MAAATPDRYVDADRYRGAGEEPVQGGRESFLRLFLVQAVVDAKLARYVGRDVHSDQHIVQVGQAEPEPLRRDEAFWWSSGGADAAGLGDELLERAVSTAMPKLVTLDEAAEALGLTWSGISSRLNKGRLAVAVDRVDRRVAEPLYLRGGVPYPLYVTRRRQRYLFAAQVEHLRRPDSKAAQRRWAALAGTLPAPVRLSDLPVQPVLRPSPDPLPIPRELPVVHANKLILQIGAGRGWFNLAHAQLVGGKAASRYLIDLVDGTRRVLPGRAVLPWVRGVAAQRGEGHLVDYGDRFGNRSLTR